MLLIPNYSSANPWIEGQYNHSMEMYLHLNYGKDMDGGPLPMETRRWPKKTTGNLGWDRESYGEWQ